MTITFTCAGCGRKINARDETAGSKGKCPGCGAVVTIPSKKQGMKSAGTKASEDKRITIRCPKCSGKMKAPPNLAGKVSPCPHCGTSLKIPRPGAAKRTGPAASSTPGLTPLDDASGLTPLDDLSGMSPLDNLSDLPPLDDLLGPAPGAPSSPFAGAGNASSATPLSGNPYQAPLARSVRPKRRSSPSNAVIMAPAIAMISVASITILFCILNGALRLIGIAMVGNPFEGGGEIDGGIATATMIGFLIGAVLLPIILNAVVIQGAVKMMKQESHGLALTAAILMIVPCNVCWLGLPVGIWALVVLSLSNVRNSFS